MKRIMLVVICLLISSCELNVLTKESIDEWFNLKKGNYSYNINGQWDTGDMRSGGWGTMRVLQKGNTFNGTLGLYYVDGVISDNKIYMSVYGNVKIDYTCVLDIVNNNLSKGLCVYGTYADKQDVSGHTIYSITINR